MTRKLKVYWSIWGIVSFLATSGTIAYQLSSWFISVPLTLNPNNTIDVSVFRILPDTLSLELVFTRKSWDEKRPELGEYLAGDDWRKTGFLGFSEPGEPIKLLVRSVDKQIVYTAMPAGGRGETTIYRDLVPFVDDGNPRHFQWPIKDNLRYPLNVGNTKLNISVIEVGKRIVGEQVSLVIVPPITARGARMNYFFLWWFWLWPFCISLLAYLGVVLLKMSRRDKT
ncbi:MAG: hypothetical protein NTV00_07505 [Methylococcales bacterium]|nr:hypothetical protein [Methylococcales bacterium]